MGLKRIRQIEAGDQLAIFKRFAEESEQGFCMTDLKGDLTYANAALCRILDEGLPEDILGRNMERYFPVSFRHHWRDQVFSAVLKGRRWLEEARLKTRTGRMISTIQGMFIIHDNEGVPLCIANVITDITDRKQAEEALRISEERYRLVVESASGSICVLSGDQILFANQMMKKTIGDLENLFEGIYPEDRPLFRKMFKGGLKTGDATDLASIRVRNARNEWQWFQVSAVGLKWQDRPAVLFQMTDIHSQKLAEAALKKAEQEMANAQKIEAIANLVAGVAHDFHNYAQIIGTNVEIMLAKECKSSPAYYKLKEIEHSVLRATELVNRLLMFRNKQEDVRQLVDINLLIEHVAMSLKAVLPPNVSIEPILRTRFKLRSANFLQMTQVLMNLVLNAKDAIPQGGVISIKTEDFVVEPQLVGQYTQLSPGSYVFIEVRDQGVGISENDLAHIFEPFFTSKAMGEGTGLGLTNVCHIIKNHDGFVSCESSLGEGARFQLFIPATQSEARVIQFPIGGHETILLVDDDAYISQRGSEYLHSYGYTAMCALSGEEAYECYREHGRDIQLVIMDLVMPGMGGEKCIEELYKYDPQVNILVASAYLTDEFLSNAELKKKIKGFVSKPYVKGKLLKAIRQAIV